MGWLCYITHHFPMHIHGYHLFWSSKYEAIKDNFWWVSTKFIYDYYYCTSERAKLKLFCGFLLLHVSLCVMWMRSRETTERLINVSPLIHRPNIYKLHNSSCCCCFVECLYFVHPFVKLQELILLPSRMESIPFWSSNN